MRSRWRTIGAADRAVGLAALLMLAGILAVFVPYLTRKRTLSGGVPAPPALYIATDYELAPGASACMSSVAVEPDSRVAEFAARPAPSPPGGGASVLVVKRRRSRGRRPPIELTISALSYRTSAITRRGHGYKKLAVAIEPPKRALLGSACFTNRGRRGVALEGSSEARTVSRSTMTVAGTPVVGDVALAFTERPRRSLLSALRTLFGRASALTGGLLPVWLIWAFAVLVAVGIPTGALLALRSALRQQDAAPS